MPYRLGFKNDHDEGFHSFDSTLNVFFIVDILVNFNTGLYKKGQLIMDRKLVSIIYVKSWFAIDLIASFPFEWFHKESEHLGGHHNFDFVHYLFLLRLVRLVRVYKLARLMERLEEFIFNERMNIILDILKLFGGIMYIAHWTACLFFSIAKEEASNDPNTWV